MNVQTLGILAGAAVIGFMIYRAAGGGAATAGRSTTTTTGESIELINKGGFIVDEKGRLWV